jgi:methyl-accepting chemotaxis protein
MKWFYNLKTSVKLISAFVLVACILAFVGWFGLNNLSKMDAGISGMYNNNLVPIDHLSSSQILYQRIRVNIRDMMFNVNSAEVNADYDKKINEFILEVQNLIDKYSKNQLTDEEKSILLQFQPEWDIYNKLLIEAIKMGYAKDIDAYRIIQPEFKKSGDRIQEILQTLIDMNLAYSDKANKDASALFTSSREATIAIILLAFLVSILLGYIISQVIVRPLNRVVKLVGKVASGDLREMSDIDTKDEIGQLAKSINNMVIQLGTTVGGILASAESVAAASQQISASTEEIASGTTSQAHDAQNMNELFKELSYAIDSVARSAEQAAELANSTLAIANDGGKVVRSSIDGMKLVNDQMTRLEQDSNKIGEIIEVIDDIAEQTNLLALNAAIEAARAGEQGKGFAVVADEVRKLAERSSEATKQITGIIKVMQENTRQSVKAVGEGVDSSQKTGEAFNKIIAVVNDSAHKVTEIAAASEEQSAQSSEVLTSIESISASTQEAAASSEETASTAQSLAILAEDLNRSVSIFKVN